jgi:hypothetical protein
VAVSSSVSQARYKFIMVKSCARAAPGVLVGLEALQQLDVAAAACEVNNSQLVQLTSSQAQLQAVQQAADSAADFISRIVGAVSQGLDYSCVAQPGSFAVRLVDVARQRYAGGAAVVELILKESWNLGSHRSVPTGLAVCWNSLGWAFAALTIEQGLTCSMLPLLEWSTLHVPAAGWLMLPMT